MRLAASAASPVVTFLVAATLVTVSLAVLSSSPAVSTTGRTSASQSADVQYASDYNSSLGLVLQLYLTPPSAVTGSGVEASVTIINTLPRTNDLGLPSTVPLGLTYYPCGPAAPPLGIFFFAGYLDSQNVSTEGSLTVTEPALLNCQKEPSVDYFAFAPLSSNVTLFTRDPIGQTALSAPRPFLRVTAHTDLNVSGYWTGFDLPGISTGGFVQLTPGAYTVVGLDPWGQMAILHFKIVPGWSPQSCVRQRGASIEPGCSALVLP